MISIEKLSKETKLSENLLVNCIEFLFPNKFRLGFTENLDFTNLLILDNKELVFPLTPFECELVINVSKTQLSKFTFSKWDS